MIGLRLGLGLQHSRPPAAEGGGGEPEWVPEGATTFIDFINGQYYSGGQEQAVTTLLGGNFTVNDISGAGWQPAGNVSKAAGDFKSDLEENHTILIEWLDETGSANYRLMTYGENAVLGWKWYLFSNDSVIEEMSDDFNYGETAGNVFLATQVNKAALTVGAEFAISMNGSEVATAPRSVTDPLGDHLYILASTAESGFAGTIKTITVYDPVANGSLPALSALA